MKYLKSHFWYNKNQRNGILLLLFLILILQSIIAFGNFSTDEIVETNQKELADFQKEIDSLKAIEVKKRKPKLYPFNPNYITDYKGEQLGMSLDEIDRLLAFRKTNKFVNSKEEFQRITKISDSLLQKISPYFKFPDWVLKRNQRLRQLNKEKSKTSSSTPIIDLRNNKLRVSDINKVTIADLQTINGVGDKLSERIIKYRTRLQGFSIEDQLYEVWGLEKLIADRILTIFKIVEKPIIKKVNINTVEFKELLKNPYIDYNLCRKIFEYRDQVAELQDISELKKIDGFPLDKYQRIVLYLFAE